MRLCNRYLIAATLVATTLCADHAATAAGRPDAEPTRGLVDRLSDALRRSVAAPPLVRQRCAYATVPATQAIPPVPVCTTALAAARLCPTCLPMPPPSV